jgi:hypothetical protein
VFSSVRRWRRRRRREAGEQSVRLFGFEFSGGRSTVDGVDWFAAGVP